MHSSKIFSILLAASAAVGLTIPLEERAETVNPNAVEGTVCTSPSTAINDHDINVALLSICGGIAGKIEQCQGSPATTTGASGTAKFDLKAATAGTTIDITKGRWEGCVRAARATCGDSPFTTTCIGGANGNSNNVDVTLSKQ